MLTDVQWSPMSPMPPPYRLLRAALLALLILPVGPQPAWAGSGEGEEVERITWDALVQEIERTSPLMAAAGAGLDAYEAKLMRARFASFPRFRLEAGAAPTPDIIATGFDIDIDWTRWGYFYRVSLTMVQPVYAFGRIHALRKAARRGVDIGRGQRDLARWELRVRAAQAYYGMLLSRELRSILEEGKRWLAKADARLTALEAQDAAEYDQMEHLRLKTRSAEFFQLEAENLLLDTTSRHGLRLLLSRDVDHGIEPAEDELVAIGFTPLPIERYLALAEENRPELRMARAASRARRALADAKSAEKWPTFVIVADGRVNDSNVMNRESTFLGPENIGIAAALLLGIRWSLDVPQRMALADEARAEARRAASEAAVAGDLAEIEVRRLHRELVSKSTLIDVYARSQKAAQGWLTAAWDTYDAGFGDFRTVMDALVQFYGKKLGYLKAVHEHNLLVHQLSRAIGRDIISLAPAGDAEDPS